MTQVQTRLQNLAYPDMPLQPAQRAMLGLFCDAADLQQPVSRLALYAVAGLNDPNPIVNNYGLRRILGSITQRLNTPSWYRPQEAPAADGGRQYHLREDLRDGVRDILANHDVL